MVVGLTLEDDDVASLHCALLQHKVQLGELAGVAALKNGHLPQESQLLSCCCQLQLLVNSDEGGRLCSNDGGIPPGQLAVSQGQLTKAASGRQISVQGTILLLQQDHLIISQLRRLTIYGTCHGSCYGSPFAHD
ncbi:MAG: hypothetical protein FRX49_12559 [Trebouxia sp. A1-2]|nr:MAG: hypothetical protein FRX49_12559 [Trebouxia sp. A1-2]